jgi:hypothetical protein
MKKFIALLSCALLVLSACGKDEDDSKAQNNVAPAQVQKVQGKKVKKSKLSDKNVADFLENFEKYDDAQKYYFCAAFAMGAMSVAKPVTASAMVNYFMGVGVAKYNVGINEETYKAFNAGKNTFRHEEQVNVILKRKICENIMNDAADFARERDYRISDLDKRGQKEVEKVVRMIKQKKK